MSFSALMYHEIRLQDSFDPLHPSLIDVKQSYEDTLPSFLFVTLEHFEQQMAYLYDNNFHTLSLKEVKDYYYQKKELPVKSVLLTFDDCYQSMKEYAYPILRKYNFHAVAFVVTHWLHDAPKEFTPEKSICLAQSDLPDMADVFEYANHTNSFHKRTNSTMSSIMVESDEDFSNDLDLCNEKEYLLGKDVFAYPFGLYEERNISILINKGFKLAFTSEEGINEEETNPFLLKRNAIPYFIDITAFKNVMTGVSIT